MFIPIVLQAYPHPRLVSSDWDMGVIGETLYISRVFSFDTTEFKSIMLICRPMVLQEPTIEILVSVTNIADNSNTILKVNNIDTYNKLIQAKPVVVSGDFTRIPINLSTDYRYKQLVKKLETDCIYFNSVWRLHR